MSSAFYVSVKQLDMFIKCPRRWAGHYLFGIPQETGDSGKYSIEVHKRCARIGKGEVLTDLHRSETKLALALTKHVNFSTNPLIEMSIKAPLKGPEGNEFLFDLRGDVVDLYARTFYDYKITGAKDEQARLQNGEPWTLDGARLQRDIQSNVYAGLVFTLEPAADLLTAKWIYASTSTQNCWLVESNFKKDTNRQFWVEYIWPAATLMRRMTMGYREKRFSSLLTIPHDWSSCNEEGKFCEVLGRCNNQPSPKVTLVQLGLNKPARSCSERTP